MPKNHSQIAATLIELLLYNSIALIICFAILQNIYFVKHEYNKLILTNEQQQNILLLRQLLQHDLSNMGFRPCKSGSETTISIMQDALHLHDVVKQLSFVTADLQHSEEPIQSCDLGVVTLWFRISEIRYYLQQNKLYRADSARQALALIDKVLSFTISLQTRNELDVILTFTDGAKYKFVIKIAAQSMVL